MSGDWSSLEIAKLAVGVLTPILLFVLAYMVNRAARTVEQAQWTSQKLTERRLDLYEKMAPKLNDLFAFFTLVGDFQDLTPPEAVGLKRELDRIFHANAPLFTPEFRDRYQDFLDVCYLTFTAARKPAQLRGSMAAQERERTTWEPDWNEMFAPKDEQSEPLAIANAYDDMMDAFAASVGAPRAGRRPRPWLGEPWDEQSHEEW